MALFARAVLPLLTEDQLVSALDDTFDDLRVDLDTDAQDLNWTIMNSSLTPTPKHPPEETMATNDDSLILLDRIPQFLLASSSLFRYAYFIWINKINSPVDSQRLEQLTILAYKMAMIHLRSELWQTYLQSGTGQIRVPEATRKRNPQLNLRIWPTELSRLIKIQNGSPVENVEDIDHDTHIYFVKEHLKYLDDKARSYTSEFHHIRMHTEHYHDTINDAMEKFVQQQALMAAKLYFQARIHLLKANYIDRFYQYEYYRLKPTMEQVYIGKHICELTYAREKAEQEYYALKIGNLFKRLPRSLYVLEDTPPKLILLVKDRQTREDLSKRYTQVIDRVKNEMTHLLTRAAEVVKEDWERLFNTETADIWTKQHQLPKAERLPPICLTIIEERQQNIIEAVRRICQLKRDFFFELPISTLKQARS